MTASADDIARNAARSLASDLGGGLPLLVEAQLQVGELPKRFDAATLIALAAFVINAAKFAWDIRRDCKAAAKPEPPPDLMARRMRLELPVEDGVSEAQRDKIITVVIDEVTKAP